MNAKSPIGILASLVFGCFFLPICALDFKQTNKFVRGIIWIVSILSCFVIGFLIKKISIDIILTFLAFTHGFVVPSTIYGLLY
jgi:hypothetical protein